MCPNRGSKRGMTLAEVLIALLLVAILATLALPRYQATLEKNRAREAVIALRAIHDGEKIHFSKNGAYAAYGDADAIRKNLGIQIRSADYDFSVTVSGGGANFTAEASRGPGKITLDQAGVFGGENLPSYIVLPEE